MKPPTLSIIIPAYNAEQTITGITSSILGQSFQDYELILVDDGSTDGTLNVLRGIKKNDPRIIIRSQKNGGPSSARNTGLDKARGKYVMFVDADDDIEPRALELLVKEMTDTGSDLLVSGWKVDLTVNDKLVKGYKEIVPFPAQVDGTMNELKKYVIRSIGNDGTLYNLWNKLFRLDIINEHGLRFREDIRFGEDLIFSFHYLNYARQLNITPQAYYHYHSGSGTSTFSASALVPEYRNINLAELEAFAGNERDQELDDLVGWVRWRWLLSFYRLVSDADLPKREKLARIKAVSAGTYKTARNARYIGKGKLRIEKAAAVLRRSPRLALASGKSIQFFKNGVIRLKTLGKA